MDGTILHLVQRSLLLTAWASAPVLVAAVVAGLSLAVVQAVTQIQEQSAQVVFKLVAVFGVLMVLGHWIAVQILQFARLVFSGFAGWVG